MAAAPLATPDLSKKLRIAETFVSIQGEGIWVGTPSMFIRVSGCNLRCVWCDTPYASWKPEGPTRTVGDLLREVEEAGVEHVVLTGGEPMLFDPIVDLATALKANGHTITIETAGTVHRDLPCGLMSISPKLTNSIPVDDPQWKDRHDATRLDFDVLRALTANYAFQLKFVVNPEEGDDMSEIRAILSQLPSASPTNVLLMAEGTDSETLHRRQRMLVETCIKEGWKMTPRLHVDIFGNRRGT